MRGAGLASARVDSVAIPAVVVCALVLCLALPGVVQAKKKRGGTPPVDITKIVNAPIPDKGPGALSADGLLTSTIDVGDEFKGRKVLDVNVTVQTLGLTGTTPAGDLLAQLVAPSGARANLFQGLGSSTPGMGMSIGPLTLDDESPFHLSVFPPVTPGFLYAPFAGSATPGFPGAIFWWRLAALDGSPVQGPWTLRLFDRANGETSSLVSWRLNVTTRRWFQVKRG